MRLSKAVKLKVRNHTDTKQKNYFINYLAIKRRQLGDGLINMYHCATGQMVKNKLISELMAVMMEIMSENA